jgi:translation initiation factor IF-1
VYTGDQLLDTDLDTISELLRVALEDRHQRLYEIREKMILRMGDLVDEPDTPRSKAYTVKRLTEADLAEIAELLRVTLKDDHYLSAHSRIREIRDRMIALRKIR